MRPDYMSKEQTGRYKGILALIVVFAHCNEAFLYSFGSWAVSVFFFLSGYALAYTSWNKKLSFGMILHKYRNFLLPMVISAIPYHILFHFYPTVYDYNSIPFLIRSTLMFNPAVQAGWYIVALAFLFTFYFIAAAVSKYNIRIFVTVSIVLYAIYTAYTLLIDVQFASANTHNFLLGILFCLGREKVQAFLSKNNILGYVMLLFAYGCMVLPLFFYEKGDILSKIMMFIFINSSIVAYLYFSYNFRLKSKALSYLGRISIWIYLYHVGIQYIIMSVIPKYNDTLRWNVITFFLATLAASFILSVITDLLYGLVFRRKKKAGSDTALP